MAKTVSVDSELRALRTICEVDGDIRTRMLSVLTADHFASAPGTQIFDRISNLVKNDKPVPRLATLREDTAIDEDTQEALIASDEKCVDENDSTSTMDLLESYRKMRVVYGGAREVVKNLAESGAESIEDSIAELERVVVRARSGYEEQHLITSGSGSNAQPVVDRVLSNERPDRIMTGFSKFDAATGGFARKDLVLMAANTGGGKSVMAEQLAINAYIKTKQNRNVALVSFEMDIEELYARLLANLTKLSFENIYLRKWTYNKEEKLRAKCRAVWESFNQHGEIEGNKFTIYCPTIDVTPNQIGALLRPGGYDLIIIDYVGLVGTEKEAQLWESLGETTRQFKGVARRNDAVIAIMAQMDEETKKIKYSKAMRHHASYVWTWEYGEDEEESGQILVDQKKSRHCKPFPFALIANFETMSVSDTDDDYEPEDVSSKEESRRNVLGEEFEPGAGNAPTPAAALIAKAEHRQRESEKVDAEMDEAKRLKKRAKMDSNDFTMKNVNPPLLDKDDL